MFLIQSFCCHSISDLGEHMYEFHKGEEWDEVYCCQYCEMKYPTKRDLLVHRKKIWRKSQFSSINLKCGFCGKQFETKNDVMNHIKSKSYKESSNVKKCYCWNVRQFP